jgi:hypothetical protein
MSHPAPLAVSIPLAEAEPAPVWDGLLEPKEADAAEDPKGSMPARPDIVEADAPRENRRAADLGAERAVLGSVLIDGSAVADALEHVGPDDFSTPEHRAIFGAMVRLYERGERPDVVAVNVEMAGAGDPAYLALLADATPTSVQVGQYAAFVAAAARRRRIFEAAGRIAEAASYGAGEDEISRRLAELETVATGMRAARAAVSLDELLNDPAPVAWTIPTICVVCSVTAVVGPPESFKSFLLLQAGLAGAGAGHLLGLRPHPLPFLYISGEKSPATVRERFRRMVRDLPPSEPVMILHRAGVTFGRGWDIVRRTLDGFGRPALVGLDTLASLSGPGFDENSGQDMAVALAAMRSIVTDYGATILLVHHPAKHAEGSGGATLRGHSSLFGEIDGVISMRRHSREITTGTLTAEPKDGERVVLGFEWSPETFRLSLSGTVLLTLENIGQTVESLGDEVTGDEIAAAFPGHSERTIYNRIAQAIEVKIIERTGKRGNYRYKSCRSRLSLAHDWGGDGA